MFLVDILLRYITDIPISEISETCMLHHAIKTTVRFDVMCHVTKARYERGKYFIIRLWIVWWPVYHVTDTLRAPSLIQACNSLWRLPSHRGSRPLIRTLETALIVSLPPDLCRILARLLSTWTSRACWSFNCMFLCLVTSSRAGLPCFELECFACIINDGTRPWLVWRQIRC